MQLEAEALRTVFSGFPDWAIALFSIYGNAAVAERYVAALRPLEQEHIRDLTQRLRDDTKAAVGRAVCVRISERAQPYLHDNQGIGFAAALARANQGIKL